MQFIRISFAVIFALLSFVFAAFGQNAELLGAGASFPYPLYSKMFSMYNKTFDVRVNYQSIGSGGGIRQLMNKTVDFGATDAFMTDKDLEKSPEEIVHIPICLGAVSVTYNIEGGYELRLTPEILADIFLGSIKKWNDPTIKGINPGLRLPDQNIVVIHRSDGSGTTNIFTDYLSKISATWKNKVGTGKSVRWPAGLGAKGNEGVAGLIKQIPGSIGYVELAYIIQNDMPQTLVRNSSGNFVKPTIESIRLSVTGEIPADTRVSLTNTDAEEGYPISGFTWIIVFKDQSYNSRTIDKAGALVDLLWWMTHEGQKYVAPLDYAPLPRNIVENVELILSGIHHKGTPVRRR